MIDKEKEFVRIKAIAVEMAKEMGLMFLNITKLSAKAKINQSSFNWIMGIGFRELMDRLYDEGLPLFPQNLKRMNSQTSSLKLRTEALVEVGIRLSKEMIFTDITAIILAKEAMMSRSLIHRYFIPFSNFHTMVIKKAIENEDYYIIAQGLAARNVHALSAPKVVREKAVEYLGSTI